MCASHIKCELLMILGLLPEHRYCALIIQCIKACPVFQVSPIGEVMQNSGEVMQNSGWVEIFPPNHPSDSLLHISLDTTLFNIWDFRPFINHWTIPLEWKGSMAYTGTLQL